MLKPGSPLNLDTFYTLLGAAVGWALAPGKLLLYPDYTGARPPELVFDASEINALVPGLFDALVNVNIHVMRTTVRETTSETGPWFHEVESLTAQMTFLSQPLVLAASVDGAYQDRHVSYIAELSWSPVGRQLNVNACGYDVCTTLPAGPDCLEATTTPYAVEWQEFRSWYIPLDWLDTNYPGWEPRLNAALALDYDGFDALRLALMKPMPAPVVQLPGLAFD